MLPFLCFLLCMFLLYITVLLPVGVIKDNIRPKTDVTPAIFFARFCRWSVRRDEFTVEVPMEITVQCISIGTSNLI